MNLTSDPVSWNWCISQIIFEIGIPNLVCKCILGCLSVTNHFWVIVNMTSDLVFKNYCVQSISPILFDVGIPNLGWWFLLGWRSGAYHFESLWPWHWLLASFLGFSCYITPYFLQMCLMLDQFLWGHSSRVCDISCSEPNSFMHMFNVSTLYRQSIKLFHQKLCWELIGPWRHHLCIYKSPIRVKLSKFSQLSFCQIFFFLNQTPSCICSMCLHCIGKVSNCSIKSCGRSWSAHEGTVYAYTKALLGKNCLSSHSCHFVKKYFFWSKLLHAYVQCVYIV